MNRTALHVALIAWAILVASCGGNSDSGQTQTETTTKTVETEKVAETEEAAIGVGPIKEIRLEELNENLASQGQSVYESKCTACHKVETRHVGPPLKGITERREPEWIMNMILNPEVMVKEDETAKALFAEYLAPMANQNLTEEEARAILEYFRKLDAQ